MFELPVRRKGQVIAMKDDEPSEFLNPLETFGVDVRELRRTRRITLQALGKVTGYSPSYVCKVEKGVVHPSERFAVGCDKAFGTGVMLTRQRERALEGDHPSWFLPYVTYERKAARIFDYSTLYVMGLLQTPEYARASYRLTMPGTTTESIESKVAARMSRRELFTRTEPPPPKLWVVLHEACLRVRVGDSKVMAGQLGRLLEDGERPEVTLQLMPFDAVPAVATPFTLMAFESRPTLLYTEGPVAGRPQDAPKITAAAAEVYDQLRAEALGRRATSDRIWRMREEYRRE
ncbi:helix-turn-helix domain-containing protein [Streptomyces sp. LE64]|uniref:helix-turn-helix domain-containing protein n=1 Tax=Streptomyces sp. LE64 TaxID=3448653 RepID=UPI004041101F